MAERPGVEGGGCTIRAVRCSFALSWVVFSI